jgi:hypothetical protein
MRVFIDDGTATLVDMTTLEGRDWVMSASWSASVDVSIVKATVKLWREVYQLSLATLMTGSKLNQGTNQVDIGREIKIETQIVPVDQSPDSANWDLMFHGEIDEIDFGGSKSSITLNCRDLGGRLNDQFIEEQTVHGDNDLLEVVIQDILTTHGQSPVPTLSTPVASTFAITDYLQEKDSILAAIKRLAQMIGWDVRYRYDNGSGTFKLTLLEPERTSPSVDRTISPNLYFDLNRASISRTRVRNFVRVIYSDSGTGLRTVVEVSDASSITKYGRRFMELAESSGSQIDTSTEANLMANAALDDLAEPEVEFSCDMRYFSPVQIGDYYTFAANNIHHDLDQDLAVVGYTHSLNGTSAKTTLQLRGKPTIGVARWLEIEGRRGNAPFSDLVAPSTPGSVTVSPEKGGLVVRYTLPTEADWDQTECHVFGPTVAADFTADSTTLASEGRSNRFEIFGLVSGGRYLVKLLSKDVKGNASLLAAVISANCLHVSPIHLNPDNDTNNLATNGNFLIWTFPEDDQTLHPPDKWSVGYSDGVTNAMTFTEFSGAWGDSTGEDTDYVYFVDSEANTYSGDKAIRFNSISSADSVSSDYSVMLSDRFPLSAGKVYKMAISAKYDGLLDNDAFMKVLEYDISDSPILRASPFNENETFLIGKDGPGAPGNYSVTTAKFIANDTTRYGRLLVGNDRDGEIVGPRSYIDSTVVELSKGSVSGSAPVAFPGGAVASGVFASLRFDTLDEDPTIEIDIIGTIETVTILETGSYDFTFQTEVNTTPALSSADTIRCAIYVNGSIKAEGRPANGAPLNVVVGMTAQGIPLVAGDDVTFRVSHDNSGATMNVVDTSNQSMHYVRASMQ